MEIQPNLEFKGVDANLEVYEDRIEIKPKGVFKVTGTQGNETIFIKDLTSVEVKECSFINGGHIQFSAPSISEKSNKITFGGFGDRKSMNENANKIKLFVINQMKNTRNVIPTNQPAFSKSDELLKLSKLKEEGILTDSEFLTAKTKLLNQ